MTEKKFVAGVLAVSLKTGRFLLIQRREDVDFPMQWSVPGGSMDESDEYPKNAAMREFKEETQCNIRTISKQPLYFYDDNLFSLYVYLGFIQDEFVPDLKGETKDGPENINYGWFNYENIPENSIWGTKEMLLENRSLIEAMAETMK